MHQLIPALAALIDPFRVCFHPSVFATFQSLVAGWVVCLGPRTISEVWQATGLAAKRHHDTAYALFHSAVWDWDDLGLSLARLILAHLAPTGIVWVAVDDTLCHKRGAKVAFGGFFLDPVLSTRKHKTFRFGTNWVVLGIVVPLPLRPDRYFCLPVLWRVYRKKGQPGHRTRTESAAALVRRLAQANPTRTFWLVGDSAYINATTLRDRPKNLQVIGPIPWKAALYGRPEPPVAKRRGAPRKKGDRLPNPRALIEEPAAYPACIESIALAGVERSLRVQVVGDVLWYHACKTEPVAVVLVRDPAGQWRDEALVVTDPKASAAFVIAGYCRRWSVELAFFDSKQYLGLSEPRVRAERSVERAHPMAWFVGSLTILWYATSGHRGPHVHRDRPWYRDKVSPTFTDMLGALRLQMWRHEVYGPTAAETPSQEMVETLLHKMAAVA